MLGCFRRDLRRLPCARRFVPRSPRLRIPHALLPLELLQFLLQLAELSLNGFDLLRAGLLGDCRRRGRNPPR